MIRWAAICVLAAGIGLRIQQFLAGRSLWIDEATLALSIGSRPFAQLFGPLDYHQTAPPGYLLAVRSVTAAFGVDERSLRLVALFGGCALLVLVWRLGDRLIEKGGGVVAAALAAFTPALIYYSNEVKPYGTDAFVAGLLLAVAASALTAANERTWNVLALLGAIAVWFSAPAVFVLAGIGVVALVTALRAADRARLGRVLVVGTVWAASFLGAYLVTYRHASRSTYMREFWEGGHLSAGTPAAIADSLVRMCELFWAFFVGAPPGTGPFRLDLIVLGGLALAISGLMVSGFRLLSRERGAATAWLFAAPALIVAAASLCQLYPMSARLLVFLLPGAIVLIAAGLVRLTQPFAPNGRGPLLIALGAVLPVAGIDREGRWSMAPLQWSESREVLEVLAADSSRAPVYVSARAIPAYAYYTTDWSVPDLTRLRRIHALAMPGGPAFENASRGDAPVLREGDGMVIGADRRELLGLSTGMQWREGVGVSRPRPSEGWAANEVRRIREGADPGVWVFFTHLIDGTQVYLPREIERAGGVRRITVTRPGALLIRYEFPQDR